jgi:ribosomal protein L37AE/L43A
MKFAIESWKFLILTMDRVCQHLGGCTKYRVCILWCISYAPCDAAKCFSGLTQIYITKVLLENSWKSMQVIYKNFVLWQCTECVHNLEDAQNASCDAATLFSGLTQIYINEILLEDSWKMLHVIRNNFLLWQCTECAHILKDIESASRVAATWFSGLV